MSMMSDHYRTPRQRVELRQKIERSEFLGIAVPVSTEEAFFAELERAQKQHYDATHHCWAFRLFTDARSRSSDAGEPSGTAGKPILNAIEGAGFHDAGVIVVRWYGGVKLGTGGLSRAYRDTSAETLKLVQPLDRYVYAPFEVIVPFEMLNQVYRLIDAPNVVLAEERFGEQNVFRFDVRLSAADAFTRRLQELRLATLP
jgi:uncharacterized YigZ family protein